MPPWPKGARFFLLKTARPATARKQWVILRSVRRASRMPSGFMVETAQT